MSFLTCLRLLTKSGTKGFKLKKYGVEKKLLNLLKIIYEIVNNSQWKDISAGVPQGSVLGPLLFLIYINDLPENSSPTAKLFADDTSLFSTVYDKDISCTTLKEGLKNINDWASQWKMCFNPDPNKQVNEVIFSRKSKNVHHDQLVFNNSAVTTACKQKHLGLILDEKLRFEGHMEETISKANKCVGLLRNMYEFVPRKTLLNVYKAYVRPHLDYADVVYDQPNNSSFADKIKSLQYNSCLAITGAVRGTSRKRIYQEPGLESLHDRRWYIANYYYFLKYAKVKRHNT